MRGETVKKKVYFYINSFLVGGIERVLLQYLKNIDKKKFNVYLIIGFYLEELEKLKVEIPEEVEVSYILENNLFCSFKKKKALGQMKTIEKILYESLSWLRKYIFEKKLKKILNSADILIDFDMTLSSYAKDFKMKKITFCHFSPKNYHRGISGRQKKLGKRLDDYDRVVVISDDMKQEALELYPFLEAKLMRFYNSLDLEYLQKRAQEPVRDQRIEERYILAIGRLEETQKDFTTLLKSYAKIQHLIPEKLYIIGEGRHKDLLEKLAKDLKITQRVCFLGFQQNPYPWIQKTDLFVHSSKFEGLPTVLIEALAFHKYIIATDCPTGPREILNYGKNGILTEIGNEKDLSEAMLKILQDNELQKEFLQNSKQWIKEFDSRLVMRKFEELL